MCDRIASALYRVEYGVEEWLERLVCFLFYALVHTVVNGDGFINWVRDTVVFWVRTRHWVSALPTLFIALVMLDIRLKAHRARITASPRIDHTA